MKLKEKLATKFALVSIDELYQLNDKTKANAVYDAKYAGFIAGFEKAREMAAQYVQESDGVYWIDQILGIGEEEEEV